MSPIRPLFGGSCRRKVAGKGGGGQLFIWGERAQKRRWGPGRLGAGEDGHICLRDAGADRPLELMDAMLHVTHEELRIEFKKDFQIDLLAGAASPNLMQAFEII